MRKNTLLLLLLSLGIAGFAAENTNDTFPEFNQVKVPVLIPRNAKFEISKDGHILVNGNPRYLPAVHYYGDYESECRLKSIGFPASLSWIYENILDYEGMQRAGFDALGFAVPPLWQKKYLKKSHLPKMAWLMNEWNTTPMEKAIASGFPLYIDFTCAPWTHGALNAENSTLPANVFVQGHFMPYSFVVPEGRQLYLDMWRSGADFLVNKLHVKPFVYELFNEPGNDDKSPEIRAEFVKRLTQKYGSIGKLNAAWHTEYADFASIGKFKRSTENPALGVEWIRFNEDLFYEMLRDGIAEIRKIDKRPDAGFCFQPMWNRELNLYRNNTLMNRISSSTGGGDAFEAHFLRALADGKPISDGEMYVHYHRPGYRNSYIRQLARGFNLSYIFEWSRRPRDYQTVYKKDASGKKVPDIEATIEKAKISADRLPFILLNPYASKPYFLQGLVDAKRDISDVNFLFAPRHRGVPRKVAMLYSRPTDYMTDVIGHSGRLLTFAYSTSLEYSHVMQDVIFEEQLPLNRQKNYDAIIAAGVCATFDETPSYLKKYVEEGGLLILGQEVMDRAMLSFPRKNNTFPGLTAGKEYPVAETKSFTWNGKKYSAALFRDTKVPASWKTLASIDGTGVLFSKKTGKGEVLFLNAKMPVNELGNFLADVLKAKKNITPVCTILEEPEKTPLWDVEAAKAVRDGFTGYILTNCALGSKLARFIPNEKDLEWCMISHIDRAAPRHLLEKSADGSILLQMVPGNGIILVGGTKAALEKKYGPLPVISAKKQLEEGTAWIDGIRAEAAAKNTPFTVDPARIHPVDLRAHANRDFVDSIEGDGKGGWTDQGATCLRGTKWGVQNCAGVPMEFIRVDHNFNRTCIVLGSKQSHGVPLAVRDIRVERKAVNMYFLHATAWSGGHSFSYIIHYADGTKIELPMRDNIEVDDWYYVRPRRGMTAYPGWRNTEGRGLFIWRWVNPHPEKTIRSLDIVSQNRNSIPIIVAISTEDPAPVTETSIPLSARIEKLEAAPGKTAAFSVKLPKTVMIPKDTPDAALRFEFRTVSGRTPAIRVSTVNGSWALRDVSAFAMKQTASPWSICTVSLRKLAHKDRYAPVREVFFSAVNKTKEKASLEIGKVSLVFFKKEQHLTLNSGTLEIFNNWAAEKVSIFLRDNALVFQLNDKSTSWCGGSVKLLNPLKIDGSRLTQDSCFRVKINTTPDSWGKHYAVPPMQISFQGLDKNGKKIHSGYIQLAHDQKIDLDPATWQSARIVFLGAGRSRMKDFAVIQQINFQFKTLPVQRSGLQFKDLEIVY